jgi:hypothetical protein
VRPSGQRGEDDGKHDDLTPALRDFIDKCIVPLLIKEYLAERPDSKPTQKGAGR